MVEPAGVAATPLVPARFVDRPNRFIVRARLRDGARIEAHLADPGRLRELLLPDAELRLRPAAPGGQRRTSHTVSLVRGGDPARTWVSVETTRANRLAESLLLDGRVHGIDAGWTLRREVRFGQRRNR